MPANEYRRVPRSRSQETVFGLDQSDLIRCKIKRFVALDEITVFIQLPPKIIIFRTKLARRNWQSPCRNVFATAEIQFSNWIDCIDFSHREMHGETMHLIFWVDNPCYVVCCIFPGQ